MKRLLWFCLLVTFCASICKASEPNAVRNKIAHDATIQGFPCARGVAWFYPDGSLNQCTLARPAALGDVRVPRGSVVELWPSGAAHFLLLPHSGVLAGHHVRGGTRVAFSRGATTAFYRTGELRSFYLAGNENIQGVPCHGGAWNTFADPTGAENMVELYQDGKLESCKLSRDFSGFRAGERIVMPRMITEAATTTAVTTTADLNRAGPAQ